MKKFFIIIGSSFAFLSTGIANADLIAECNMPNITVKYDKNKNKKVDWISDHRVILTNETDHLIVYHLDFFHHTRLQSSPYKSFDLGIYPGQYHDTGLQKYNTKIEISEKGQFNSIAVTRISVNGQVIKNCEHVGTVTVF